MNLSRLNLGLRSQSLAPPQALCCRQLRRLVEWFKRTIDAAPPDNGTNFTAIVSLTFLHFPKTKNPDSFLKPIVAQAADHERSGTRSVLT